MNSNTLGQKKLRRYIKLHYFTPDELLVKYYEFIEAKGYYSKETSSVGEAGGKFKSTQTKDVKMVPLTDIGFMAFLGVHCKYLYELPEQYDEVRQTIKQLQEEHTLKGIAVGDIAQSFGVFYLKNKFKYTEKVEQLVTTQEATPLSELSDEQLKAMLNE